MRFWPETCSRRQEEAVFLKRREAAELLVREYVPQVRAALENAPPMYVPGGNRELAEASAVFYAVLELCGLPVQKDLSRYSVRPTDGGDYIVNIELERTVSDPDYRPSVDLSGMWVCGSMWRKSEKYPVSSWSADSRFTSRTGGWENNRTADFEYLYEYITGAITDSPADADKFERLRGRGLLTDSSAVNAVVVQGDREAFFARLPRLSDELKKTFAGFALENAETIARDYPPQMRDLVVAWEARGFVGGAVAMMVQDSLYSDGTFRPLTEQERAAADLLVFSDVLPEA